MARKMNITGRFLKWITVHFVLEWITGRFLEWMQYRRGIAPVGFEAKVLQVWELEDKLAKLKETDA